MENDNLHDLIIKEENSNAYVVFLKGFSTVRNNLKIVKALSEIDARENAGDSEAIETMHMLKKLSKTINSIISKE